MVNEIVGTVITFTVSGMLGYLVKTLSSYKNRDNTQEEALKCLLRSAITSKYYIYNGIGSIPQYEKENINYMYEQYKKMNGNSYVKQIVIEINKLPISNGRD